MRKIKNLRAEIEKYLKKSYRLEIIPDAEGGFVAYVPDLPGCITQAETIEEVIHLIKDAKRAWIECALENNIPIPEPSEDKNFSDYISIKIPKKLYEKLRKIAEKNGLNTDSFVVKLLSDDVKRIKI